MSHQNRLSIAAGLAAVACLPLIVRADITGFGNFSNFSVNVDDGHALPLISPGSIRLTGTTTAQTRSIFSTTQQNITDFTAKFTFRATGAGNARFGACFVVQNDGPTKVATTNASGVSSKFGYSDNWVTLGRSMAVSLEHGSLGTGSSSTAVYKYGQVGAGSADTSPLDLFSGNPIRATISYDGSLLHTHYVDTVTLATYDSWSPINIASIVGGSTAYVGFTAASMDAQGTEQFFSDFSFSTVPSPAALPVLAMGSLVATRRRRAR